METGNKIVMMNLSELTHHPKAELGPMLAEDDPQFLAMVASIRERGLDYPILTDSRNRIVDGRHRCRAAKAAGLTEAPVRFVAEDEAATIVLESLAARRHFSKNALAYLSLTLFDDVFSESRKRRIENLKRGNAHNSPKVGNPALRETQGCKTASDVASAMGFSRDTMILAKKVSDLFADKPEFKEEWEPLLLSGKSGFQQILAAHAGREATKGKKKIVHQQMALWDDMVRTVGNRVGYLLKVTNLTMRREKLARLAQALAGLTADDMKFFKSAIRKVEEEQ